MENVNVNLFEFATRNKFRWNFNGSLTVEDLWDLSREKLNQLFKELAKKLKKEEEDEVVGLLDSADKEKAAVLRDLRYKIMIVEHIFKVKQREHDAALSAQETRKRKQKILEAMAAKEDEGLNGMTLEQLAEELEKLG